MCESCPFFSCAVLTLPRSVAAIADERIAATTTAEVIQICPRTRLPARLQRRRRAVRLCRTRSRRYSPSIEATSKRGPRCSRQRQGLKPATRCARGVAKRAGATGFVSADPAFADLSDVSTSFPTRPGWSACWRPPTAPLHKPPTRRACGAYASARRPTMSYARNSMWRRCSASAPTTTADLPTRGGRVAYTSVA